MLEAVLNINRPLADTWHFDYGLTSKRNRKLLASDQNRNSFKHPGSETALSLFMFGNMDNWKQIGHGNGPRNQRGKWSRSFFDALRKGELQPNSQEALWPRLNHGVFQDTTLNWCNASLMFEFEVMNSAFHTVDRKPFKELSFFEIKGNKKWGAFDAFMAVPAAHPTEQRRGVLIGFEAKLNSDISPRTKGFDYVNQIMRNLEAGYKLTHHHDSLYRSWEFHYVFVCPRQPFILKAMLYSWMLFDATSKKEAVAKYREVIEHLGVHVDQQDFDRFGQFVRDRVTVLHWDNLANALLQGNDTFWDDYLERLHRQPDSTEVLRGTRSRLESAGISVRSSKEFGS